MKKIFTVLLTFAIVAACCVFPANAASSNTLSISAENISHEVSATLYGTFIEDISKACDGGLVSNLVYNNSFEYNDTAEENAELNEAYWVFDGVGHQLLSESPMNENNTHYEAITVSGTGAVKNLGCVEDWDYMTWNPNEELQATADMGFCAGVKYDFSCYLKNVDFTGSITVYLESDSNSAVSQAELDLSGLSGEWAQFGVVLESAATEDGALAMEFNGSGTVLMDFAQLIPENAYGYGTDEWPFTTLRADLAQALVDMNPSFIRFPGGCFCEGDSLDRLYNWKNTIGPVEERVQTYNVWRNDDAGDYYINSNFMGYGEYFNLCADIGAEPLPCLNVGLTCQGRNNYDYNVDAYKKLSMTAEEFTRYLIDVRGYSEDDESGLSERTAAVDALGYESEDDWRAYVETIALTPGTPEWDSYVQDILDLIEFANGTTDTYWGALRAQYGHEAPYNLKYLELGNENWGEIYWRNFEALYKEVKAVYPEITIITTSGPANSGADFDDAWETANADYSDCYVDEHYYTSNAYLYETYDRYDSYDRSGAKVFLGEWAATASGVGTIQTKSNMMEALEEAAYMTGLEKNSDIVAMSCYAPTFAKVNAQNWAVNEIWFDSQEVVRTPSYYTQMLYANNLGTQYIDAAFSETVGADELAQSVTVDTDAQVIYVKIVNSSGKKQTVDIELDGFGNVNYVSNQNISQYFLRACNEAGKTQYVAPQDNEMEYTAAAGATSLTLEAGGYSVNVIRIAYGDNDGASLWQLPGGPAQTGTYIPLWLKIAIPAAAGVVVLAAAAATIAHIVRKKKANKNAR